jgi:ubiquinone/menaquinone biosynthesis C-methylase UbiE
MDIASAARKKAYKGLAMEGIIATWYAKNTVGDQAELEACAARIATHLGPQSRVLEVAPGPGYLAIALARLGPYRIAGVDISRSFVSIAADNAARAGVEVEFRHGDAAAVPYPADSFDFTVCLAAFKNFSDPIAALAEMHRVLRPGGQALIIDMRNDASNAAIDATVDDMKLGRMNALITRAIFKYSLRKRAYSKADMLRMAAATPFHGAEIREEPLGFEVWLRK